MSIVRRIATRIPGARAIAGRGFGMPASSDLSHRISSLEQMLHGVNHLAHHTAGRVNDAIPRLDAVDGHFDGVLNGLASFAATSRRTTRDTSELRALMTATEGELLALRSIAMRSITRDEVAQRFNTVFAQLDTVVAQLNQTHSDEVVARLALEASHRDLTTSHQNLIGSFHELSQATTSHADTVAWTMQRVEAVRSEFMYELRWGKPADGERPPSKVVNPDALVQQPLRVNLGCGTLTLDGYVNVDGREVSGVDVVAPADNLPMAPGSIDELFSAHFLEHFSEEQLHRGLLKYWVSLIRPGGTMRAIVPDFESMVDAWKAKAIPFETLRAVMFGGQEYEGDFHFTMYTVESLTQLFELGGLADVQVIARGRPNGDCLEMELTARKPLAV